MPLKTNQHKNAPIRILGVCPILKLQNGIASKGAVAFAISAQQVFGPACDSPTTPPTF